MSRKAKIVRKTKETNINIELNIDGTGIASLDTGLPFLEHMLEQVAKHGMFDLKIKAKGDLEIAVSYTHLTLPTKREV